MSLFNELFGLSLTLIVIALIFYVIFGQVTVRKLRKNPETRDALGFEYASGTDIIKVIKVLAISRSKAKTLRNNQMSFLNADVDLVYEHTSRTDRFLAKTTYFLLILGVGMLVVVFLLEFIGAFE